MSSHFLVLQPEIQEFIKANEGASLSQLALRKNPFSVVNWTDILAQIEGRQKSKEKLPTWYTTKDIIYPIRISLEQTSSEKCAAYKASIVDGYSIIDLSGGFGVDSFYFSKRFTKVIHCEINQDLSTIACHNFKQLGAENVSCHLGDSDGILKKLGQKFDWIFIDPSRRNDSKGKVFMLKDCTPNIPALLDDYSKYSDNILLKTAPLLDISAGLNELKFVKKIHVVAVDNEVKELLWEISKGFNGQIEVSTVNLMKDRQEKFSFVLDQQYEATFGSVRKYIYEPNRAIMKSGGFNAIAAHLKLDKLHSNTHLYTSDEIIEFPGRLFCVDAVLAYRKTEMKAHLSKKRANVTVRNFGETVEHIRKKWRISEGGDLYCFFTTDLNESKIVLLCSKIIES